MKSPAAPKLFCEMFTWSIAKCSKKKAKGELSQLLQELQCTGESKHSTGKSNYNNLGAKVGRGKKGLFLSFLFLLPITHTSMRSKALGVDRLLEMVKGTMGKRRKGTGK